MTAPPGLEIFVAGAITAGFAIAGLFFLRFWIVTRDSLFAAFAAAFWLMGLNQVANITARTAQAENSAAYLFRLAAFLLIILAILNKNRRGGPKA